MSGAYLVDGALVAPEAFYAVACDPRRSVVVEACAGAGKTWMLVSRMLRAMMDGTPPHQILAITFTRKAAGEMRGRLQEWMHTFAQADDEACDQALLQRGVPAAELPVMRERLRGLQAAWMADGRSVEIHTILGWFAKLVQGAPLDVLHELGLPPDLALIEDTEALWPQLWGRFLRTVDGDDAARAEFQASIGNVGRHNTEAWLQRVIQARLEVELADREGRLDASVPGAEVVGSQWAATADVASAWQAQPVLGQWWALAKWMGSSTKKTLQELAGELERALTNGLSHNEASVAGATAKALRGVLYTGKGQLRKALEGAPGIDELDAWMAEWQDALAQQAAQTQHLRMCRLSRVLLACYRQLKRELAVADMVDLELAAARLMADPVLSGWVQERLDHQVRHVLMDEFQDTSPLQWHTLRAWLSAYAGAGGGSSGQQAPSVFLVGDPKQSIYRFRRADPRVFQAARQFVVEALDGAHLACDHTRRNAQAVIRALNATMGEAAQAGLFPDFRTHSSASEVAGDLWVLPQIPKGSVDDDEPPGPVAEADPALPAGWRDTLRTPRYRIEASRREREAEQTADAVEHFIHQQGVAAEEIFVLARRRVTLEAVAQSLAARQVAHMAPESDLLTDKLEVQDLMAMVEALLSPANNLALAHALRSPLFGVSDEELLWLKARWPSPQQSWLSALLSEADGAAWPARLQRAATLIASWMDALRHLPPHDLLERIVRDTQLRTTLAAAVPAAQVGAALFHIDALLAHSLEVNAGRDLTPYRWLRELLRNPPKLPPRASEHAVQLLTVHGAKGLEAEVVILADMDAGSGTSDTYGVMIDWPEGEAAPLRCAFVASEAHCPPSLRGLLEAEDHADAIERMNGLYVAMTRAKRCLVCSSTQPTRGDSANSWWQLMHRARACPEPIDVRALLVPGQAPAHLRLPGEAPPPHAVVPGLPPLAPWPVQPGDAAGGGEHADLQTVLGLWVHGVLERITPLALARRTLGVLRQALDATQRSTPAPREWPAEARQQAADTALALVQRVLASPQAAPWLQADGWAWAGNEVAMADADGNMRLDRLVARQEAGGALTWWVIDYKLQHDPLGTQAYHQQMARYVRAVRRAQPGERVGGGFITSGGEWVVWCEPAVG